MRRRKRRLLEGRLIFPVPSGYVHSELPLKTGSLLTPESGRNRQRRRATVHSGSFFFLMGAMMPPCMLRSWLRPWRMNAWAALIFRICVRRTLSASECRIPSLIFPFSRVTRGEGQYRDAVAAPGKIWHNTALNPPIPLFNGRPWKHIPRIEQASFLSKPGQMNRS